MASISIKYYVGTFFLYFATEIFTLTKLLFIIDRFIHTSCYRGILIICLIPLIWQIHRSCIGHITYYSFWMPIDVRKGLLLMCFIIFSMVFPCNYGFTVWQKNILSFAVNKCYLSYIPIVSYTFQYKIFYLDY